MRHVGIFEAKTHLSALIEAVERGEEIVITRHGAPVARLTSPAPAIDPAGIARRRAAIAEAAAEAREIRRRDGVPPITIDEILEYIHEGRR